MKLYDKIKKSLEKFCYDVSGKINKDRDTAIKEQAGIIIEKDKVIKNLEGRIIEFNLKEQNLNKQTERYQIEVAEFKTLLAVQDGELKQATADYKTLQETAFCCTPDKLFKELPQLYKSILSEFIPKTTDVLPNKKLKCPEDHRRPKRLVTFLNRMEKLPYITRITVQDSKECNTTKTRIDGKNIIHIDYQKDSFGVKIVVYTTAENYLQNTFVQGLIEHYL